MHAYLPELDCQSLRRRGLGSGSIGEITAHTAVVLHLAAGDNVSVTTTHTASGATSLSTGETKTFAVITWLGD
jgi:hypothetical protein